MCLQLFFPDITASGRQVQIPMTVNSTGNDPSVETGADNHLQNGETSQRHTDNSDTNQKSSDNDSTQPTTEENNPPEASLTTQPALGGETEQQGEATTSSDSKAMELEKSDTMEKGKGKKGFVLGVADENGTEGEVEIDSPDQEDAEKGRLLLLFYTSFNLIN